MANIAQMTLFYKKRENGLGGFVKKRAMEKGSQTGNVTETLPSASAFCFCFCICF